MKQEKECFSCVEEHDDAFLQLWSHRYDYIWSEHAKPGEKPKWQTESRHPLSDRLILQGSYLYGVRFGSTTSYLMLDIDRESLYHPANDPFAIARMMAALEELGLVEAITITSSYSKGLHLYFPFETPQKTWELAITVAALLENAGFKQAAGHLEIYPNPRQWGPEGEISLYQAHRLPLQTGSYILNQDFEPIFSSYNRFVELWQRIQPRNRIDAATLTQILKSSHRRKYRVTTKAEKFLNDLNAEIERGWTGAGMTNRLLGRITMRSYIFGHLLHAAQPLEGKSLVDDVVKTARELPGFTEWCRHQHEIEEKAKSWAQAIERSQYFHYGIEKAAPAESTHNPEARWEALRQASREKIRLAIATLLNESKLPIKAGERFRTLTQRFQIGGKTLYKHKDLWHPEHLAGTEPVENPPHPPTSEMTSGLERCDAPSPESHTSLLATELCNSPNYKALSSVQSPEFETKGCNKSGQIPLFDVKADVKATIAAAQAKVRETQAQHRAAQAAKQRRQEEASRARMIQRMKGYLESGDPVLMSEALNWMRAYPEYGDQLL